MKAVLIGYGEVGKGLYEVLSKYHDIVIHDKITKQIAPSGGYDLMLVAIPYSGDFVEIVTRYQQESFDVKATIIFSSVPIGTSSKCNAIHSPIEGQHGNMAESIKVWPRWIGGNNDVVTKFFQQSGLQVFVTEEPEATEFLKLASTTIYGINIEWARYMKESADRIGFDFSLVKRYNNDHNFLVQKVHQQPNFIRYNLDPPKGVIGGHCVLPNAELLELCGFDHPFIDDLNLLNGTLFVDPEEGE